MPSLRQIRRRVRSVENTAKITKAMSMIAASKMRRAPEMALQSRPYAETMRSLLSHLAAQPRDEEEAHDLLTQREVQRIQLIHITPDRGLTGGLNSNLNRAAGQFVVEYGENASVIAVGRKGRDFFVRAGANVKAVFSDLGDRPSYADITPVARIAIDDYLAGESDAVFISYGDYVSTTVQRPRILPLIPVEPAELDQAEAVGYIYEPDALEVLAVLLPRFIEMQIYHAVLEGVASEQSARMVAMQSATDNANEMIGDLTLEMNKARQDMITGELLDLVGGAAAIEG